MICQMQLLTTDFWVLSLDTQLPPQALYAVIYVCAFQMQMVKSVTYIQTATAVQQTLTAASGVLRSVCLVIVTAPVPR